MRAAVYDRYGPPEVVQLREIPKPTPQANEVLIEVRATTVGAGDWRGRTLDMPAGFGLMGRLFFGISRPRQPILGSELAGRVESVGKEVTRFKAGDEVFAFTGGRLGCHAEYKCFPQDEGVAQKPANLTWDEAAAMSSGGTTALHFLKKGNLRKGEKVLVNGASGGVGTAAVQLARHFGADVTGVCSAGNAELARSLGARRVIDYTQEDFTTNGETYDVIVDTAGTAPFSRSKDSLKEGGRLLLVLSGLADLLLVPWVSMTSSRKVIAGPATWCTEDLEFLAGLARAGEFRPVIDRRYPFGKIADAHRYVETGRKKGNVIITVGNDDVT